MKKILVSACLLGTPCRYDGKSKPNNGVIALGDKYELIPVCPECLGGLETPRLPAEIQGERVVRIDGVDVTAEYNKGAQRTLEIAKSNIVDIAVLKSKSPSCSKGQIYDGTYSKTLIDGKGITARLLEKNFITVIDENELEKL